MTEWNGTARDVSGDVRLDGYDETVGLRDTEDVFVDRGAVGGVLAVEDAEYVYTDVPAGDATQTDPDSVATIVSGDEDGYVHGVDGDLAIRNAGDVYVAAGGAETLAATGAEQVFHGGEAIPTRTDYEVTLTGWNHDRTVQDPRDGVAVLGARNELRITKLAHETTVYVVGWGNEIRVEGQTADVTVYVVGRDNAVSVGPFLRATMAAESGTDNRIDRDPIPPSAVIQTTKADAFADAGFGRHKLTWQEPADEKDWCPNCGTDADAVVVRRQRDAFFLFGTPVRTYDDGGESYECEECTTHLGPVSLSEAEREQLLR